MTVRPYATLLVASVLLASPAATSAQIPDLSGNWMRGRSVTFNEWAFTTDGQRRFDAYDFRKDDPALGCIAASWTRVWLTANVVVRITQAAGEVRLQYEWMDIDRRIPVIDPAALNPKRSNIATMPALGRSAAWYDGDTLVIDTIDFAPGFITTMEERAGMPQSRRMHTIERLRRSGDVMTVETTHVDPAYYRAPVLTTIEYRKTSYELETYACSPEDAAIVSPRY